MISFFLQITIISSSSYKKNIKSGGVGIHFIFTAFWRLIPRLTLTHVSIKANCMIAALRPGIKVLQQKKSGQYNICGNGRLRLISIFFASEEDLGSLRTSIKRFSCDPAQMQPWRNRNVSPNNNVMDSWGVNS